MVDGDPQQRAELSKAVSVHMPNAIDGGCGWHIVEQGWKAHGHGKTAVRDVGGERDKRDLFKKRVKAWLCSWMSPSGVDSEDEHSVSKQLLFSHLASPEVLDACDGQKHVVQQVSTFIWEHTSLAMCVDVVAGQPFILLQCSSVPSRSSCMIKCSFPAKRSAYVILTQKPQAPMKAPTLDSRNVPLPSSPAKELMSQQKTFLFSHQ
jgi:hypothetical protein